MLALLAHWTPVELPSFGLALLLGFVAGVATALAVVFARRSK